MVTRREVSVGGRGNVMGKSPVEEEEASCIPLMDEYEPQWLDLYFWDYKAAFDQLCAGVFKVRVQYVYVICCVFLRILAVTNWVVR